MFGLYEIAGDARKVRIGEGVSFDSLEEGIAHFGDKVVSSEIEGDDYAVMFVNIGAMGAVYSIEAI